MTNLTHPIVLLILDGWGHNIKPCHNAIAAAKTPQWDDWQKNSCLLDASGLQVGLPEGQMGNSEVGHMHIGAGRVLMQDFTRINKAIETGEFFENPLFNEVLSSLDKTGKALHIMGLLSEGGVHSHEEHLYAFLRLCKIRKFHRVYLHLFLDGRDTPPQSALKNLHHLQENYPDIQIASLSGRYYAMDRDKRWDRTEKTYRLLTENKAQESFEQAETAIHAFYERDIFDEFIPPTRIGTGKAIEQGDALFFFNFRSDRARQLTEAFINPDFQGFSRQKTPELSTFISMTSYADNLPTAVAFLPLVTQDSLGEVLSRAGLKQLRIAETEKYAHVTFFFNGGVEQIFPGESRKLIPSPKVATYDLKPEMSAPELTDALIEAIDSKEYAVIICNYANADMVGHTGDFQAAVQAVECLDNCMQKLGKALERQQGYLLITADHGNAEIMYDKATGQPHTAHTCQPVPFVFVGNGWHFNTEKGSLIDIAPTLLTLAGLTPPASMTGKNLLIKEPD